ncbi:MAG: LuxR C-terminal-related transcriptional regulator [Novosphingobium sp.]
MARSSLNDRLLEAIGQSPIPMVASNPLRSDNPLEIVNPAFCALTGYGEDEILGRNCRFLSGEGTEEWLTEQIRQAVRQRVPTLVDILNYRKDGTPFRNGVLVAPLFDDEGDIARFLGSQVELGMDAGLGLDARRIKAKALVEQLPTRQRQVLHLMARGLLNKQIAWQLKISEKTVKMHRALLLQRLGVTTSAEAIRIAVEAGT